MKNVLTVVVSYNAMLWIDRCLGNLRKSSTPTDIFVIDNGSSDGTQAYIQKVFPEVIFYQAPRNLGFGKGNNIGIKYAIEHGYDYVYLLNQDAWFEENVLSQLISIKRKHPEYGILSPLQKTGDGSSLDKNFDFNVQDRFCPNMLNDMKNGCLNDVYETHFVMAAHWFFAVADILKVGMFSSAFTQYGEDGNMIDRFHYWNFKVGICPKLNAFHDRQYRVDSPEKKLYLKYTLFLQDMNNPMNISRVKAFIRFVYKTLKTRGASFSKKIENIKKGLLCIKSSKRYRKIYMQSNCFEALQQE